MAKNWDKENMKVLGVNMKKDEAEAFQKFAAENNTTVGSMLRLYVQDTLRKVEDSKSVDHRSQPEAGIEHLVSYENTDRLKHEVAFYNPNHRNPNGMLNDILDEYFAFVEKARKRSR